jgi:flagellar biosynthesis protein FlhG
MEDAMVLGPGGLRLLPGIGGGRGRPSLDEQDRSRLVQLAEGLGEAASVVLFDCAAGIGRNVCAFTRSVDDLIIVTTPEPTALVDAYALVVAVADAPVVPRLHLVVNMAQDKAELAEVQERFLRTCDLFQGLTLEVHPGVPLDPVVRNAVRQRLPFMLLDPNSAPSKAVDRIAGRLLGLEKPTKRRWWSRLWS